MAAEAGSKPKTHHLTFAQADVDASGDLTIFEFATTRGPGTPFVEIRRRFLPIDVSGAFAENIDPNTGLPAVDPITGELIPGDPKPDKVISQEEWDAYRALEEKPKSDLSRFKLADFNDDGELSLEEFGYLVSPKVKSAKTLRKFEKRDVDDSGFISPLELKKSEEEEI